MSVQLPTLPIDSVQITLKNNVMDQQPTMGGPTQRLVRDGSRFSAQVTVRTLTLAQAQPIIASLNAGITSTVLLPIPVAGVGSPGSPYVANTVTDMASQITLSGFTPDYTVGYGAFFTITTSGTNYLYQTTTNITADGSGNATFGVVPYLRTQHQANDVANFTSPNLQGFLQGTSNAFSVDRFGFVTFNFSVLEAA